MTNIKKDYERGAYYFVLSDGFNEDGKRRQIKRTGFNFTFSTGYSMSCTELTVISPSLTAR